MVAMIDNYEKLITKYFDILFKRGDTSNCLAIKSLIAAFIEDVMLVKFKDYVSSKDYDKLSDILTHLYNSVN